MITSFGNKVAKDIWESNKSKTLPRSLWLRAKALLTIMHATRSLEDLKIEGQPPDIRLHKLKGNKKNLWCGTVKLPWCITFEFQDGNFSKVKIEDYHRG